MVVLEEYLWITVVGGLFGFIYAFGIGANDVANAFASTVAAKSLTLKQAVLVAGIFEFCGAFFLGASVTSTIRSKIFNPKLYKKVPEIVMLGMMTSLATASVMLLGATAIGAPVSTTHTIVGCIMGFSIAAKGFDSIEWPIVYKIFISWAASPLVSGALAFFFFGSIRIFVLRHENSFNRAFLTFPIVLTIGIGIDLFYVLYKGLGNTRFKDAKLSVVLPISFGVGAFCGLIWLVLVGPFIKKRVERNIALRGDDNVAAAEELEEGNAKTVDGPMKESTDEVEEENVDADEVLPEPEVVAKRSITQRFADATYGQDLQTQSFHESHKAEALWQDAEQFDEHAEELFTYVQVFTACLNSFAHGANDVANAIAPISAIVFIYQTGSLESKAPVQKWVLAYGGVGIVVGLLLYGYKVIKSLGYKLTPLSPSRGACAELAASLFVVTASFMSIPVSSTQSIVGAVAGVGLAGGYRNVDWFFLFKVCLSWVFVFFASVILSAGLFAFVAYSPTLATPLYTNRTAS